MRQAAQVVVAVLLLVAFLTYTARLDYLAEDRARKAAALHATSSVLADVCAAASPADLRLRGLLEDCLAAQAGHVPTVQGAPAPQRVAPVVWIAADEDALCRLGYACVAVAR